MHLRLTPVKTTSKMRHGRLFLEWKDSGKEFIRQLVVMFD